MARTGTDKKSIKEQTEEILENLDPTLQVIVRESKRLREDIGRLNKTIAKSNRVISILTFILVILTLCQFSYFIGGEFAEILYPRISKTSFQIITLGMLGIVLVPVLFSLHRRNRLKIINPLRGLFNFQDTTNPPKTKNKSNSE